MPAQKSGGGPVPAPEEGVGQWLELCAEPPRPRVSAVGSTCVGRKASSPGPQPGAIPWLRLLCSDEGLLAQPERPPVSWPTSMRPQREAGASSRPGAGGAMRLVSPSMRQLGTSCRRRSHLYSTCCTRRLPSKLSKRRQSPAPRGAMENTGGGQRAPARTRALGCTTLPLIDSRYACCFAGAVDRSCVLLGSPQWLWVVSR